MSNRQLWNWILYPVRMALYAALRRAMRKTGILR